jgi:hypothetical protein
MSRHRGFGGKGRTPNGRSGRFLLGFLFGIAAGATIFLLTDSWMWGVIAGLALAVLFGLLSANKVV